MLKDNKYINDMLDNVIWYYTDIYKSYDELEDVNYIISSRDLTMRVNDLIEDINIVKQCHLLDIEQTKIDLLNNIIEEIEQNKHVQDLIVQK